MSNKVLDEAKTLAAEIHVEKEYSLRVLKCNRGGYIVIRGADVGASMNIEETLDFIRKDVRAFMNEPQPPAVRPPTVYPVQHMFQPNPKAVTIDRRWTFGEMFSTFFLLVLLAIVGYQMLLHYWPNFL